MGWGEEMNCHYLVTGGEGGLLRRDANVGTRQS